MGSPGLSPPAGSCVHLVTLKEELSPGGLLSIYSRIARALVAPASASARANKAHGLFCHMCGQSRPVRGGRIHVCLQCIHFACFPDHWQRHLATEK